MAKPLAEMSREEMIKELAALRIKSQGTSRDIIAEEDRGETSDESCDSCDSKTSTDVQYTSPDPPGVQTHNHEHRHQLGKGTSECHKGSMLRRSKGSSSNSADCGVIVKMKQKKKVNFCELPEHIGSPPISCSRIGEHPSSEIRTHREHREDCKHPEVKPRDAGHERYPGKCSSRHCSHRSHTHRSPCECQGQSEAPATTAPTRLASPSLFLVDRPNYASLRSHLGINH